MRSFWIQSFVLHGFVASLVAYAVVSSNTKNSAPIDVLQDFEIIEVVKKKPVPVKVQPQAIDIAQKKTKSATPVAKETERVFGVSKDTLTTDNHDAIIVKKGNTITTEVDDKVLKDDTALPTPTPAFLVSQMPVLRKEVKPAYPKMAREKNIEGKVVLNVLIDQDGAVRAVDIVEDPGYGMGAEAKEAMFGYEFMPAKIDGKDVAVEVRYVVAFELL